MYRVTQLIYSLEQKHLYYLLMSASVLVSANLSVHHENYPFLVYKV